MATPVVGNSTKAVLCEEKQLGVPSVRAQRPAMRKRCDRAFAPVFVVDPCAIFHGHRAHVNLSFPYLGDVEEKAICVAVVVCFLSRLLGVRGRNHARRGLRSEKSLEPKPFNTEERSKWRN